MADRSTCDPGPLFADAPAVDDIVEDRCDPRQRYDLCLAVGTLDTVNDLPRALLTIRFALRADALLHRRDRRRRHPARASSRDARRRPRSMGGRVPARPSADRAGRACALLSARGLCDAGGRCRSGRTSPIASFDDWSTIYAHGRDQHPSRAVARRSSGRATAAAPQPSQPQAVDGRTHETFEILHFAAWTPRAA